MSVLLIALAALLLSGKFSKENPFADFFKGGDSAPNIADMLNNFTQGSSSGQNSGNILELLSNPLVIELIGKFLFNKKKEPDKEAEPTETEKDDFFKPVEKVAGIEISKELYDLYDNWYIKSN